MPAKVQVLRHKIIKRVWREYLMNNKREAQQFNYKNGRGTIHFPDVSDKEYERRHKELERVAIIVLKEKQRINDVSKKDQDKGAI